MVIAFVCRLSVLGSHNNADNCLLDRIMSLIMLLLLLLVRMMMLMMVVRVDLRRLQSVICSSSSVNDANIHDDDPVYII